MTRDEMMKSRAEYLLARREDEFISGLESLRSRGLAFSDDKVLLRRWRGLGYRVEKAGESDGWYKIDLEDPI